MTPPTLSSFPAERDQLEYSSRSLVFVQDGERVLRVWGPPHRPWVLGVEDGGTRWTVTAWGASPSQARAAVRSLFSFSDPLQEFYRLVRRETVLAGTERTFRGLRIPRDPSLYEALVHSIVGQQISVGAANAIKRRLIEATGAFLVADGVSVPRIPASNELLALGEDGLRRVGLSRAKSHALQGIARREMQGAFQRARFARCRTELAVDRLDAEPGVGRWTAENALLRGIGRRDLFVAGDLGVRAALSAYHAVPRKAPEAAARLWADTGYPGWGSYATLYLWRKWIAEGTPTDAG